MTISESKGRFFYKTNRFESIRITNRTESIRIANWNALARTHTTGLGSSAHPRLKKLGWTSRGVDADPLPFHLPSLPCLPLLLQPCFTHSFPTLLSYSHIVRMTQ